MQCLNCGKSLDSNKKIYCDNACRYAFYAKNGGKAPMLHKTCKRCGKPFETKQFNQVYCCYECAEADRLESSKSYKLRKTCLNCGKKFVPSSPSQIFCSKICRYDNKLNIALNYTRRVKGSVEPATEKPIKHKDESNFDRITREADECGLSYGMYRAQLKLGKTYEQLKADYESRRNLD